MTADELIKRPRDLRPHVVLLGAGASRAAFPNGDAAGRKLPVMNDIVDVLGLGPLLRKTGYKLDTIQDFEVIYSRFCLDTAFAELTKEIEYRVTAYFSQLCLPRIATIYDRLLLSLKQTDAVFTFNWDPFLFDSYQRNRSVVPLPEIFFLHGNVRIGACPTHDCWGDKGGCCRSCSKPFSDVPLLYPVEKKDYSQDPYIRRNWDTAAQLFKDAFTLSIFGYGAPRSDSDAVNLLRSAWTQRSDRSMEHIEIIDTAEEPILSERWSTFTPTHHYRVVRVFDDCRIAGWPRRTCESLLYPMSEGVPCQRISLPRTDDLAELQNYVRQISQYESHLS